MMDWLGEIGGITELFNRIATFILGGYFAFNQAIEINHVLCDEHEHNDDDEHHEHEHAEEEKEENKCHINNTARIQLYFLNYFKCFNCICKCKNLVKNK